MSVTTCGSCGLYVDTDTDEVTMVHGQSEPVCEACLPRYETCPACDTVFDPQSHDGCPVCPSPASKRCQTCWGTGHLLKGPCWRCAGSGRV